MSATAVYRYYDAAGRLLYVGTAVNPVNRALEHGQSKHWFGDIAAVDIALYASHTAALAAELDAIRSEWPLWNSNGSPWQPALLGLRRAPSRIGSRDGRYQRQDPQLIGEIRYVQSLVRDALRRAGELSDADLAELRGILPPVPAGAGENAA